MLRRELGDSVFKKCISQDYANYAGKNADTRDLQKVFEVVSGKNLSVFFDQLLYRNENPKLDINWKYNAKDKTIVVSIKQLKKKLFQLPLEIYVQEPVSMPKIMRRLISKVSETFIIPVKTKPVNIKFDPNTSLLFESTIKELK